MNPKVLSKSAWAVVRKLVIADLMQTWVLAGGTGLALQLGHRVSNDLDFFTEEAFDAHAFRVILERLGRLHIQAQDADTLHTQLDEVRLSFLRSEAPFLFQASEYRGLRIADPRDIAAMKIVAIGGRGSRKDFVDLYAYLEAGGDFLALIEILRRRYAKTSFNEMHLLRSLVYFDDAEQEPMPKMIHRTSWSEMRSRLEKEARRFSP